MTEFVLSPDPILAQAFLKSHSDGASLRFLGVVRGMENGHPILGIHYDVYQSMAEPVFSEISGRVSSLHGDHRALVHHRSGFVPSGEPSLLIEILTPHSSKAFEICRCYLDQIKADLPIWKKIIFAEKGGGGKNC